MFLIDKIEPLYFFISLFIGLFITYTFSPDPEVIIKFPTPENAGKIIYRDNSDNCFKFKSNEVKCPSDNSKIKSIPIQN
jgi:hypothetical protein